MITASRKRNEIPGDNSFPKRYTFAVTLVLTFFSSLLFCREVKSDAIKLRLVVKSQEFVEVRKFTGSLAVHLMLVFKNESRDKIILSRQSNVLQLKQMIERTIEDAENNRFEVSETLFTVISGFTVEDGEPPNSQFAVLEPNGALELPFTAYIPFYFGNPSRPRKATLRVDSAEHYLQIELATFPYNANFPSTPCTNDRPQMVEEKWKAIGKLDQLFNSS